LSEIFKKLFDLKISLIDKKIEDEDCFFYKYSLMKDIEEYVNKKLIKEDLQPEDGRKSGRRKLGFAASEKLITSYKFITRVRRKPFVNQRETFCHIITPQLPFALYLYILVPLVPTCD
jgi:hypothetical protein